MQHDRLSHRIALAAIQSAESGRPVSLEGGAS